SSQVCSRRLFYRMFKMKAVYIISDNQYFALGAAALIKHQQAIIVSPEELLNQNPGISSGDCYIFVRNRVLHRRLCCYLKQTNCNLIFFLPGLRYRSGTKLLPCFWPARISAKSFRERSAQVARYFSRSCPENTTLSGRARMSMAAAGLERYMRWVRARSISHQAAHSHHRALIKTVGIENVSIHTLFLSEYIAASHIALS
ncbi:TPA: hypothetical protein ACSPZB_004230, partial [Citrobacter freundii]